jgi:hypothetical protein
MDGNDERDILQRQMAAARRHALSGPGEIIKIEADETDEADHRDAMWRFAGFALIGVSVTMLAIGMERFFGPGGGLIGAGAAGMFAAYIIIDPSWRD